MNGSFVLLGLVLSLLAVIITSYLWGALFVKNKHGLFAILIGGFLSELAVWEIITLLAIYFRLSLSTLSMIMVAVITPVSVISILKNKAGLMDLCRDCIGAWTGRVGRFFTRRSDVVDVLALMAFGIIFLQTFFLVIGTHYDHDDAFYVAAATTAVDTDSLYRYTPFTGAEYHELPARYILSPWSMFPAVLSFIFGVRPIIIFHTMLPAVIIPFSYGVMYLMATGIWRDDEKRDIKIWGFLIAVSFLQIFGAFSTWSVGMRLLVRVWQGKTVLASVVIPLIMTLLLLDRDSDRLSRRMWFYIFITLLAGCFLSSMGVILPVVELGALGLTRAITKKNLKYSLALIPCCIPNVILGLIYLAIR